MKKTLNAFLMGLVLMSSMAQAEEYPAADFQPKVLYTDSDYKPPAESSSSTAKSSASDSKYPAADFQPEVLYKDSDYKPTKAPVSSSRSTSTSNSAGATMAESTSGAAVESSEQEEDSAMPLIVGLAVLGLAGYFYTNSKKTAASKAKTRRRSSKRVVVASSDAGGESGVAKYLASQGGAVATGVAKYLSNQTGSASRSASGKVSGVDKYLQNKG